MSRSALAQAGQIVQRHVRPGDPRHSTTAARTRLLEELQRRRSRGRRIVLTAAAAVVVMAVVLLLRPIEPSRVSFTVGPDAAPGQIGAYVTPVADEPLELHFSEGSLVALEPATRARVTETTRRGAIVLVETGRARVDVVHHPETDWQVLAGPYTIRVRGTSFDVGFEPSSQTLEVAMRSGVVSVQGPGIASPLEIRGAQRFVHTAASNSLSAAPSSGTPASERETTRPASERESAPPGPQGERATAPEPTASPLGSTRASGSAKSASWSALVAHGEYRQVLESAEERGVEQVLASAGPVDLMALGNAARFSGRGSVASQAYRTTRDRFAGSPQAAEAAFLLGRMAEGGDPTIAVGWYDRYVTEAPAGPFVAEAWGRRMVALKRGGNVEAARAAARSYLERFPSGPYAGVAREMTTP
jgi:TolA-binding protein